MLHSQNSKSNSPRRAFSLFLVFGLILVAALVSAWRFAPSLAASKRSEKTNVRISQRDLTGGTTRIGSEFAERASRTLANPMFAAITVDRTDDTFAASACTVAPNDCSLRGAVNFANLNPGTTINIPAGTYNLTISGAGEFFSGNDAVGDLDITASNTTIAGAGAATTIIHQTTAGDRVIEVNPFLDANFIASISDVTISGGTESTGVGGGGIISGAIGNSLTLTNCVVSGNSATGAGTFGGGGISHSGGSLTITGCTFSGNSTSASGGGAGYSAGDPIGRFPSVGTLRVSGSTFINNTANSSAAGGAALDLFDFNLSSGSYLIDSTSFKSNTATNSAGGAIIVESGGPLTVTTSSFDSNHAATRGGAVFSTGGVGSVKFSRLVGNSVTTPANGNTIFFSSGLFAADDDWWGVNSGPNPNDFRNSAGTVFPTTFLQLRASATPSTICSGSSSSISADIKQRNIGSPLTVELNGLPAFPASIINGTPALGSLSGVSANFVNGSASATFNAGATPGTANINVTADNQSVTASVVIQTNTTTDPSDQTLCPGSTATFTTTASGPGPFTFVWKKGATTLSNGDLGGRVTIVSAGGSSTLSISNVQASDGDTYTVEATGACSTATQSATLTINAVTSTSTPTDQTVCQGTSATFSTTASGTGPFHYAWTVDGSASGGDSASLTVATGSLSVGNHSVSVTTTGACGSDTKGATLTVQASTSATTPGDQTVCQGANASFSTTASGTGPFHYAWTVDGSATGGDTSSVTVSTGSLSVGNHAVSVTVTGSCGSATKGATLTVNEPTSATTPADQTVCPGVNANFSTTASGTGPFHYAWTVDGSAFGGDTSSITVPTGSLSAGNHPVSVTVSGSCGSVIKNATLTVQQSTSTTTPGDQTVCQGTNASFSTTASGVGPFHYAWTVDGSASGGDSASLAVATGSLSVGSHTVSVTTTGTCGSDTKSATLNVQAPTSTTAPGDQTVCQGANASFSTSASGTGPFHYAWTVDGSATGGDSASITVATGSLSVGNHTVNVTVSGSCGSATQSATLTVNATTTATTPSNQTVCPGVNATFSTTAGGTGPFHYAWTVDGSAVGGDSASVSVPTGSLSSGNHAVSVTVSGSCGSATRNATLTVTQSTTTSDPADQSVCLGGTASFTTNAAGTGPFSFVWKQGATVLSNGSLGGRVTIVSSGSSSTLTITNVQAGDLGTYSVDTTGSCNTATQSANLSVNSTPPTITLNGNQISLWPPNHSYHTINVTDLVASATSCDGSVNINSVVIDHVTSDEAENGNGDGNTLNDIVISCNRNSVQLRAERDGSGDGRVYTIYFKATDSMGHSTTVTATVTVPKSQNGNPAVDSGPHYTVSTATCP